MEFVTKYFGKLKGFNFEKINKESFLTLISSGIFDEYELTSTYKNDDDYFTLDSDTMEFGDFFIFNRKEYHLKKEIIFEMIYVKNWCLETFENANYITNEIETLVISEFQLENKLRILEENYKKYFDQITDKKYYGLYKNESFTDGYENWKQYIISDIIDNENYKSAAKFLNRDSTFFSDEIESQWNDYFVFSKISDYCEEKRNLLLGFKETNLFENPKPSLSDIIFKNNSEEIFKYIVSKFSQEKNKAFFSYLFHYFSDNDLLYKDKPKSSRDYSNYLISEKHLDTFSKVIQRVTENSETEKKIFQLFKKYHTDFIQK